MRRLGVSRSAAFALMIPVFGMLQAMLVLGEHVAGTAVIGAAVVLAGVWLVQGGRLPTLPSRMPPGGPAAAGLDEPRLTGPAPPGETCYDGGA